MMLAVWIAIGICGGLFLTALVAWIGVELHDAWRWRQYDREMARRYIHRRSGWITIKGLIGVIVLVTIIALINS
jgi:uncharacterized membrane protein YidH (DUF202 family)